MLRDTRDQAPHFDAAIAETEEQIQLLQLAYEESGEHERALLRGFAAASLWANG